MRDRSVSARTRCRSARWHCGVRGGGKALLTRRQNRLGRCARAIIVAGLSTAALALSVASASAQNGFFESLFGRRWSGPTAYADPSSQFNPFGSRPAETPRVETGVAYCVRLCDGRFFPIQRHGGVTPAQACSSFCPASQTKIYNGSSIENASGPDGKRYADLSTAFVYRDKIVPGCTCNGKDALGLVNTPIDDDPTLRPGDIVATNDGLMAYTEAMSLAVGMPARRSRPRTSRRSALIPACRRTCAASSPKPRLRRQRRLLRRPPKSSRATPPKATSPPPSVAAGTSGFRPTDSRLFR